MSIPKGEFVRHKSKGYVGEILGTTKLNSLMEERGDAVGYRVKCGPTINIASEKNLEVLPNFGPEQRHKANLMARGIPYRGIKMRDPNAAYVRHRSSHCWACHHRVDSKINIECKVCGWIICGCGACGCGYVPKHQHG
jgi:hypothetical protein